MTSHLRWSVAALAALLLGVGVVAVLSKAGAEPAATPVTATSGETILPAVPPTGDPVQATPAPEPSGAESPDSGPGSANAEAAAASGEGTAASPPVFPAFPALPEFPPLPPLPPDAQPIPCPPGLEQGGTCMLPFPLPPPPPS